VTKLEPVCEEPDVPIQARPKHIAIIMDGNGRWAQQRNLSRSEGHLHGVETVGRVMEACRDWGIQVLTLYCFSSENWKRPEAELEFLMDLLTRYLIDERQRLIENNMRVRIIGQRSGLPKKVLDEIDRTLQVCQAHSGMTLCLAINYGSRAELVGAIRNIASKVQQGQLLADQIDEALVSSQLSTAGLPDPDLLIRTSGEMRISNFLLWQISYSEFWVTRTLWPDFDRGDLLEAIRQYANRDRRFGGLKPAGSS
jgi:undecaprenyl diphosphate synthase